SARPAFAAGPEAKRLAGRAQLEGRRLEDRGHARAQEADLRLEHDAHARLHAITRHLHEGDDVGVGRPAAIDDQVAALRGDLGAAYALAAQSDRLHEARCPIARRILPDVAGGGEGEGLCILPHLHAQAQVLLDALRWPAHELEPAADHYRACGQIEAARPAAFAAR